MSDFQLTTKSLGNIASLMLPKDFTFIVDGKEYECNYLYAVFLSPIITEQLKNDKNKKTFTIDIPDPGNKFEIVMNLLYGGEILPTYSQALFIRKVGAILGNEEMANLELPENSVDASEVKAFFVSLITKYTSGQNFDAELEEVASHLYLAKYESISELPPQLLYSILTHPSLILRSEKELLNTITKLIDEKGDEYRSLLSTIHFNNLDSDDIKLFTSIVQSSDITTDLLNALNSRLSIKVRGIRLQDRYLHKEIPIEFDKEPLNGIFAFLRRKKHDNPVTAGFIEMTQGDRDCSVKPETLLDYGTRSRWYLAEREDNWLQFDFKEGRFALNAYTITSGASSSYWEYPVSWTMEGSNDRENWERIDKRDRNMDMGGNEKTHTWTCPLSPLFRYIRFRLRNVTRRGGLYCREFEFFGAYLEPPE